MEPAVGFKVSQGTSVPPLASATVATGTSGGAAHYNISATEFKQKLHRDLPLTTLWGYGGTYPGPTIEAFRDAQVTVSWINNLRVLATQLLRTTHYLPVDLCLHGPNMFGSVPRLVTHLHGARVKPESDGYPEAWYLPAAKDIPDGYASNGSWYDFFSGKASAKPSSTGPTKPRAFTRR